MHLACWLCFGNPCLQYCYKEIIRCMRSIRRFLCNSIARMGFQNTTNMRASDIMHHVRWHATIFCNHLENLDDQSCVGNSHRTDVGRRFVHAGFRSHSSYRQRRALHHRPLFLVTPLLATHTPNGQSSVPERTLREHRSRLIRADWTMGTAVFTTCLVYGHTRRPRRNRPRTRNHVREGRVIGCVSDTALARWPRATARGCRAKSAQKYSSASPSPLRSR